MAINNYEPFGPTPSKLPDWAPDGEEHVIHAPLASVQADAVSQPSIPEYSTYTSTQIVRDIGAVFLSGIEANDANRSDRNYE